MHSVDATKGTTLGRLVNDSIGYRENAITKVVRDSSEKRHLCLFAKRDIARGEEIRYDYGVPNLPWRKVSFERNVRCNFVNNYT